MTTQKPLVLQATCVAIDGRALAIQGSPGTGKSTLALALIDRGAQLVGDDAITLTRNGDTLLASPPPNISGLIEVHGVGLIKLPVAPPTPLALILDLESEVDRLPERLGTQELLGCKIPLLPFYPGSIAPAVRAEWALSEHGEPVTRGA